MPSSNNVFTSHLAFRWNFVLAILAYAQGSNASGLTAVALSALLAGLTLAVPLAKADAASTSNAPLYQHLRIRLPCICLCRAARHVLFRGIIIIRLVGVVVIFFADISGEGESLGSIPNGCTSSFCHQHESIRLVRLVCQGSTFLLSYYIL